MNVGIIITVVVIMAIFVLPFIFIGRSGKRSEKKGLGLLTELAKLHKCEISRHEIFGKMVIGLAEKENILLFVKQEKEGQNSHFINLTEIQTCRIIDSGRTVKANKGKQKITEKLDLGFSHVDKSKPDLLLEFFNSQNSMQLDGELQFAQKWQKIIQERLNKQKK